MYTATLDPFLHGLLDEELVFFGRQRVHGIPHASLASAASFPYVTFVSLPFYHDRRQLAKVTCVQLTETKMFFTWDAMYRPNSIEYFRRIGVIGAPSPTVDSDDEDGLFTTAHTVAAAAAAVAASVPLLAADTTGAGPSTDAPAQVDANESDDESSDDEGQGADDMADNDRAYSLFLHSQFARSRQAVCSRSDHVADRADCVLRRFHSSVGWI